MVPPTGPTPRRVDAERNRARVLETARRLVAERGLPAVTMDALAQAAGVGKGTVYRAVGSRGGLAQALADDAERGLQDAVLQGPPPLGPGGDAAPAERIAAFADGYLRLLDTHADLLVEVDHHTPGRRFTTAAYAFWRAHVRGLCAAGGDPTPQVTAELILGMLAADLHRHLRREVRVPADDVRRATVAAVTALTRSWAAPDP